MRWSQAWMLLALSALLNHPSERAGQEPRNSTLPLVVSS